MNATWDRLSQLSHQLGQPLDDVARHHILEGVLRRLARSPHADDVVLRGSMLTRAWVGPQQRFAQDLDFVGTFPHSVEEAARRFVPVLAADNIDDEVCVEAASLRAQGIWLNTAFPGVRLFFRAGLSVVDRELAVDVGFNDPLVPPARLLDYPTLLPMGQVAVWAVRQETAVAWKLHGLAEMGASHWRPKDLHDLDLLTQALTLDPADLIPAIDAAFRSRGYPVSDAVTVFDRANWWELKSARVKWMEYRRAHDHLKISDNLETVLNRVHQALRLALTALEGKTT
jgi:hypothetical protein